MRKTKEEAAQTKDQLLDSALELFIEHGYSRVTLQQIAEYVNLTRGAFYWHFKSKEEILEAIVSKEQRFIENFMVDLFTRNDLPPDEHINLVIIQIIKNFFENKRYRNFVQLTWFSIESNLHNINEPKTIANEFFIYEIEKIIRKGIKLEVFEKDESAKMLALQITATINGIYRLHFLSPSYMRKEMALKIAKNLSKTFLM